MTKTWNYSIKAEGGNYFLAVVYVIKNGERKNFDHASFAGREAATTWAQGQVGILNKFAD